MKINPFKEHHEFQTEISQEQVRQTVEYLKISLNEHIPLSQILEQSQKKLGIDLDPAALLDFTSLTLGTDPAIFFNLIYKLDDLFLFKVLIKGSNYHIFTNGDMIFNQLFTEHFAGYFTKDIKHNLVFYTYNHILFQEIPFPFYATVPTNKIKYITNQDTTAISTSDEVSSTSDEVSSDTNSSTSGEILPDINSFTPPDWVGSFVGCLIVIGPILWILYNGSDSGSSGTYYSPYEHTFENLFLLIIKSSLILYILYVYRYYFFYTFKSFVYLNLGLILLALLVV